MLILVYPVLAKLGAFSDSLGNEEVQKIAGSQKASKELVRSSENARTKAICSLEVRSWIIG